MSGEQIKSCNACTRYHVNILLSYMIIYILYYRIEELEEELKSEKAKSDELLEQQRLVMINMMHCVVVLLHVCSICRDTSLSCRN